MNTSSRNLKYKQIEQYIRDHVADGSLRPGQKLDSEFELSKRFNVSRQTVRQALKVLSKECIIESRRGSGTFISSQDSPRVPSKVIGVISSDIDEYIFPAQLSGIDEVLKKNGYSLHLVLTHDKFSHERTALQSFISKKVDGIIVEPSKSAFPPQNQDLYDQLKRMRVPIISINVNSPYLKLPYIGLDDRKGGYIAANHLIEMGHRDIAGLFKLDDYQGFLRYSGFMDSMKEADLPQNEGNVLWYCSEENGMFETSLLGSRLSEVCRRCTAMLCYNDEIAYMLIQYLRKCGLSVPEDLSIIGYDDSPLIGINVFHLTTIHHPGYALGKLAAEHLLRLISDLSFAADYTYEPQLIMRNSVHKR